MDRRMASALLRSPPRPPRDEQQTACRREDKPGAFEEVGATKLCHPLVGEHEGHVLAVGFAPIELNDAHFRRGLAHDAVAITVPVGELALYLGESMGIVIHRQQYRPS